VGETAILEMELLLVRVTADAVGFLAVEGLTEVIVVFAYILVPRADFKVAEVFDTGLTVAVKGLEAGEGFTAGVGLALAGVTGAGLAGAGLAVDGLATGFVCTTGFSWTSGSFTPVANRAYFCSLRSAISLSFSLLRSAN